MKAFIILFALIGLSYGFVQTDITLQYSSMYPIRALAILRGETRDSVTNQLYKIFGSVLFEQFDELGNVTVTVDLSGLPPHTNASGVWRGLHIHTYGILNVTDDVKSACGSTGYHWNPTNSTHGDRVSDERHFGDLGNVLTFQNGTIRSQFVIKDRLELFGPYSIIGRSVVLHEQMDDLGKLDTDMSRLAGTSGSRIACGVIGLSKSIESESVEYGFFNYYSMNASVSLNETAMSEQIYDPLKWLNRFIPFDGLRNNASVSDSDVDEDDFDNELDQPGYSTVNQPFGDVLYTYLQNVYGSLKQSEKDKDPSNVVEPIDEFALLRKKLLNLV